MRTRVLCSSRQPAWVDRSAWKGGNECIKRVREREACLGESARARRNPRPRVNVSSGRRCRRQRCPLVVGGLFSVFPLVGYARVAFHSSIISSFSLHLSGCLRLRGR